MKNTYILFLLLMFSLSCSSTDITNSDIVTIEETETTDTEDTNEDTDSTSETSQSYKLLSLGDSYTIGQSVCATCRFPEQLKDSLLNRINNSEFSLNVIAQTGWTTRNLIEAIESNLLDNDYDIVTLLIGVNNQYQNKPFSLYQSEFPLLVQTAIAAAQGDKTNVVVLSIPDYAYTTFGQNNGNPEETSSEIDMYNAFAENYCNQQDITFLNITDITRLGLENTSLVASDGLHPSELAYSKFVERLLPIVIEKIE
ncbi:SGNH/GDSL hydrolase family protein [Psychroserpens algicola]|uniref:SGNH/GDSL hydrolase family protein n=1 Tax=Psychroserpens algicola TaxID=1719034 RepID=A0ABT0H4K1_9FLAO|nr:SGNH/GDSL hydrolase family protein [Psychroserpens algicola]MCK8479291.1 SGNH/GDSL hydrolase family protein [Psychroserpens algicola]